MKTVQTFQTAQDQTKEKEEARCIEGEGLKHRWSILTATTTQGEGDKEKKEGKVNGRDSSVSLRII